MKKSSIASCPRGSAAGAVGWTKRLPFSCDSSAGLRRCPVELPITAESNCGSRARLALAVTSVESATPSMPSKPNRPLSYGSTAIMNASTRKAPSPSAPRNAARQRSQPAAVSELEIGEFIDVLVSQLDQQQQHADTQQTGENRPRPSHQQRDGVLAGRRQKRKQHGRKDRQQVQHAAE